MLIQADARHIPLKDNTVDAVVTDPPYGLEFMGKSWDGTGVAFDPALWAEVMRVMKPGAHLLAFGGTRTYHRMVCAIEDAGFEVRDCLMWVYGSGFPKSLDVSKAIDKAAGAVRAAMGLDFAKMDRYRNFGTGRKDGVGMHGGGITGSVDGKYTITAPATDDARQWQGWGTALKPAYEPIVLVRKPLSEGTVAANVLRWGCGALNIDGCRIGTGADRATGGANKGGSGYMGNWSVTEEGLERPQGGRWPANFLHDGSDEVVALFPETGGELRPRTLRRLNATTGWSGGSKQTDNAGSIHCDSGSAARFFYCAKASPSERGKDNTHPTVKPVSLLTYLCRLVTPPGGLVLDPFCGSGSTGRAAIAENFRFIGLDLAYHDISSRRVRNIQRRLLA